MNTIYLICLIYVILDIIATAAILIRAKVKNTPIRTLAFMLADFWNGKFRNYDTMRRDAQKYEAIRDTYMDYLDKDDDDDYDVPDPQC